jgi:CRP-like cAMP-binding protein
MKRDLSHARGAKRTERTKNRNCSPVRKRLTEGTYPSIGRQGEEMEVGTKQAEAISERMEAVAAHPLAELLDCPPEAGNLLNGGAECLNFDAGEVVFRQNGDCKGLYVVVSGLFLRKAERLNTRLTLGPARAGDLVELAAALGDGQHTYTLTAQTPGSLLLLPIEGLSKVFENYPPLRMRLLEELAREVSRAYLSCCLNRTMQVRRRSAGTGSSAAGA